MQVSAGRAVDRTRPEAGLRVAEDANGYPVYRDGLTRYNGLDVVAVPSLVAGEALVYDRAECFWVVAEDFTITPSRDYAPAYERDSVAMRTSGQFGVGVPNPTKAIR
jgi:hypothetical protein